MQDPVDKFCKPGELVVDLFYGTLATAKACLETPWHRRLVGSKIDCKCFAKNTEALVETYEGQVSIERPIFWVQMKWLMRTR